ncbi:MAG TPA: histidine kinase N-terminal 7TM domain-containing protein [Anaerolineae bacterium]|nr:histidine kinase N-terminal 7TM domain-containing protein [Anaerolineae bacterium]
MSWRFVYAPNIWPLAFAAVFLLFLSWVGWRNRHVPGALPFALAALCLALWAAAATLEVAAADVATAVFWVRFAALWQLPSTIAMLCFALQFAGLGRWLSRCTLALLCLPVLLADGLMLTNDLHHLVWQGFVYVGHVRPLYGALITPMVAYGYLPATATIVILVWLFSRSPRHRRPVALALCGQAVIRVAYAIDFAGANPLAPLDLTILAALVAATLYAIALFHFRVFDPAAVARAAVIDQMGEGMVVLDDDGCVADLNATAESILDISAAQARGLQAASVLPWWQKQSVSPRGGGGGGGRNACAHQPGGR